VLYVIIIAPGRPASGFPRNANGKLPRNRLRGHVPQKDLANGPGRTLFQLTALSADYVRDGDFPTVKCLRWIG
jgi:hypothetical protein